MEKKYKTFDDLEFRPWGESMGIMCPPSFAGSMQAVLRFDNGYGVSVLLGEMFYSNGSDTYELAVLKGDDIVYPEEVCGCDGWFDVLAHLTKDEVTEAMKKVQDL